MADADAEDEENVDEGVSMSKETLGTKQLENKTVGLQVVVTGVEVAGIRDTIGVIGPVFPDSQSTTTRVAETGVDRVGLAVNLEKATVEVLVRVAIATD